MKILGITGGIGVGKDEVAMILAKLYKGGSTTGIKIINADALVHSELTPSSEGYKKILKTFGAGSTTGNSIKAAGSEELDRAKLAQMIFQPTKKGEQNRHLLEAILHPLVIKRIKKIIKQIKSMDPPPDLILINAALILEANQRLGSGKNLELDGLFLVQANLENCIKRVMQRDNLTSEQIKLRMQAQMDFSERLKLAKKLYGEKVFIIENNGSFNDLKDKIIQLTQLPALQE